MFKMENDKLGTSINTMSGKAFYYGSEIEDNNGKFDDSYSTSQGYYLIHSGKYHRIYKLDSKPIWKENNKILGKRF